MQNLVAASTSATSIHSNAARRLSNSASIQRNPTGCSLSPSATTCSMQAGPRSASHSAAAARRPHPRRAASLQPELADRLEQPVSRLVCRTSTTTSDFATRVNRERRTPGRVRPPDPCRSAVAEASVKPPTNTLRRFSNSRSAGVRLCTGRLESCGAASDVALAPAPVTEQPEAVREPITDLPGERLRTRCGGQLHRQGKPVDFSTYGGDVLGIFRRQP